MTTKAECVVLLPYLKDEDAKLRYIAESALEGKLKAFPAGARAEAFTDRKQDANVVTPDSCAAIPRSNCKEFAIFV
ncbi:MAG: hypothetical protein ACKVP0_05165 [Pirellulaceae bacterium]